MTSATLKSFKHSFRGTLQYAGLIVAGVAGSLLIMVGVFAPFVGTFVGGLTGNAQIELKGLCPYCGGNLQTVVFNNQDSSICCLLCQHSVAVKENQFAEV
jgi:hypothetical protein